MNLLTAFFFVTGATAALCLGFLAVMVALDGRDARRDAARRNQAHRL
jgi:hypothetical protein